MIISDSTTGRYGIDVFIREIILNENPVLQRPGFFMDEEIVGSSNGQDT